MLLKIPREKRLGIHQWLEIQKSSMNSEKKVPVANLLKDDVKCCQEPDKKIQNRYQRESPQNILKSLEYNSGGDQNPNYWKIELLSQCVIIRERDRGTPLHTAHMEGDLST